MESPVLHTDTVCYQPLKNSEEDEISVVESHYGNSSSTRNSWIWFSFRKRNDFELVKKNNTGKLVKNRLRTCMFWTSMCGAVGFFILCAYSLISSEKESIQVKTTHHMISHHERISSNEKWQKYTKDFFGQGNVGTREIIISPSATLSCLDPGLISVLVNSSKTEAWQSFTSERMCSEQLITEKLELTGHFSNEDLRSIFSAIPNIVSLQFFSIYFKNSNSPVQEPHSKIYFPMLTSLSIVNADGEVGPKLLELIDQYFEMPFLSEILILNSNVEVLHIKNLLKRSIHLKSFFLIGNMISCNETVEIINKETCPQLTQEMNALVEFTLINEHSVLNSYWVPLIQSLLLNLNDQYSELAILKTNIPVDPQIVRNVIENELDSSSGRQVYEISFKFSLESQWYLRFISERLALFEKKFGNNTCEKLTFNDNEAKWLNLCKDSQRKIMYGYKSPIYVKEKELTLFLRRAKSGTVNCQDLILQTSKKEGFLCGTL